MDKARLKDMFDNLLHIGNKTNYWNPRMKSYIYGSSNGVHIIDLTQTASQLDAVSAELQKLHSEGKKILLLQLVSKLVMHFLNLLRQQETTSLQKNGFLDFLQISVLSNVVSLPI